MTAQPKPQLTSEEYLLFERASEEKHEYIAGMAYLMAGGSKRHNRIAGSTYAALYAQLRRRNCIVYPSDMRVKSVQTNIYTYPDIAITCGNEQFEDEKEDTLLNPVVLIEVLSPSTEKYDRGKKFQHYRTILSLREYVLIAQDDYHIERFARQSDNTWVFSEAIGKEATIELTSIQCVLALEEVYEKIDFTSDDSEEA
ncbi:Uma2 family endonuclease [Candidatus Gracilibacteria bacterium]|nr:Uma2 family endonuclease [Candidatus Gracilibacteria bacterium]